MAKMFRKIKMDLCKYSGVDEFKFSLWAKLLSPRFCPILNFRVASYLYSHKLGPLSRFVSLSNQILFGCDIARGAQIDGGFYMPHPCGVVIGEYARVGRDFIIHQGVTLGARGEAHELSNPTIGDYVEIGTGAKVLGKLTVGNYARVGANSVLLCDIPDNGVAVGIPARLVKNRDKNEVKEENHDCEEVHSLR